ncbi:MAG: hypothetical protein COX81_01550, partial [Candidatus Magasanikbacteria bacterium CG_4_10_14_0_2_um_filter_37_12]
MTKNEVNFLTRHAQSERHDPLRASKEYPSLTIEGVEQSKDTAKNKILELIKSAQEGAIIFIGGASDQARTAQTAEIYGDALEEVIYDQTNNEEIEIVTKKNIDELIKASNKKQAKDVAKQDPERSLAQIDSDMAKTPDYEDVLQQITEYLKNENPRKKIVIAFPAQLKGFSY